jgi:hypothetical protein
MDARHLQSQEHSFAAQLQHSDLQSPSLRPGLLLLSSLPESLEQAAGLSYGLNNGRLERMI